jgi:hypothetical protein
MKNNLPTIGSFEVLHDWIVALATSVRLCASSWAVSLGSIGSVIDLYLHDPLDFADFAGIFRLLWSATHPASSGSHDDLHLLWCVKAA